MITDKRCNRHNSRGSHCKELKFQGYNYCKKHYNQIKASLLKQGMKGKKQVADFREGQHVEVARDAKGFKDSWFTAKILKLPNPSTKKPKLIVEYNKLLAKENEKAHLKESVDPSALRPVPPAQARDQSFQLHQCVDALSNQGWWKGQVFQILENNRYLVHFPAWNEYTEFKAAKLRVHLDWVDGKWVTPQLKDDQKQKGVAHTSLQRKWQINQCSRRPNSKLQSEIGDSSLSVIATRTTTSSIKARETLHQTISETRDPRAVTPDREFANVVQPGFLLEGAQLQILGNTDDQMPQQTERDSKKQRNEELPEGSLTDSVRTSPARTTTESESFTISDGQEALLQQKKGRSQDSTDHPTSNPSYPQSLVDSRLSVGTQGYEINQQEGDQSTCKRTTSPFDAMMIVPAENLTYETPSREGVALETNIIDVTPLSMFPTEYFHHAISGDVPYNQVASTSNMEITLAHTSLNDEAILEDGKTSYVKSLSPVWQWLKRLVRK